MNRLGFILLSVLEENQAMDKLSAMTIQEMALAENFGCKENTIYKKIKEQEQAAYINTGLKDGRANTYYLTLVGYEYLKKQRMLI